MDMKHTTRRSFIKKAAGSAFAAGMAPNLISAKGSQQMFTLMAEDPFAGQTFSPNDTVRIGAIGMGIIGHYNIDEAIQIPGVELAAACDLYDGRLQRVQEKYGQQVDVTRDFNEILDRDDIDAVLIATPDHWHDHISIAAMEKGKAVYCEKPMVHHIEEGKAVIDAEKKTGQIIQIGSHGVSSVVYQKAGELYRAGAIGDLVLVEAAFDRHSSLGAWQYSIPPDASPQTVDWERFLGDAPKRAFDPMRFFRWRNYQDYGTAMAGDLFVHLFSWLHSIIDSNGPERIYASGGLRYWNDGREVPDVMIGIADYPDSPTHAAFNLQLRVNFVAGGPGTGVFKLIGTEGALIFQGGKLTLHTTPFSKKPGYGGYDSLFTFSEDMQKEFVEEYKEKFYDVAPAVQGPRETVFEAPDGYSDRRAHWLNLILGVRTGKPVLENATFGLRATGPSLLANMSQAQRKPLLWDPEKMVAR